MRFEGESKVKFRLLKVGAFKQWFSNKLIPVVGERATKMMSIAEYWLTHRKRRQYLGIEFAPTGFSLPHGYYNMWQGLAVEPRPGDCSKFLAHLRDNVACGDDELYRWIEAWFAAIFQKPNEKYDTAVVLKGEQGVGKTKVGEVVGYLLGIHYMLVADPRYVTGRFNSHMSALLLLQADEAFWAGDKKSEGNLKNLISGQKHPLEFKGIEVIYVNNLIRLFVTGNQDWVIPAGFSERRFAVLEVGKGHMQDHPYFAAIDEEMRNGGYEALLHHFLNVDISNVNLRSIPKTEALMEQKIHSATPEQGWWLETLKSGMLPGGTDESNTCLKRRLSDCGLNRPVIDLLLIRVFDVAEDALRRE